MLWYLESRKVANGPKSNVAPSPAFTPKLFCDFAPAISGFELYSPPPARMYALALFPEKAKTRFANTPSTFKSDAVPPPLGASLGRERLLSMAQKRNLIERAEEPIANATIELYPGFCVSLKFPMGIAATPPIPSVEAF